MGINDRLLFGKQCQKGIFSLLCRYSAHLGGGNTFDPPLPFLDPPPPSSKSDYFRAFHALAPAEDFDKLSSFSFVRSLESPRGRKMGEMEARKPFFRRGGRIINGFFVGRKKRGKVVKLTFFLARYFLQINCWTSWRFSLVNHPQVFSFSALSKKEFLESKAKIFFRHPEVVRFSLSPHPSSSISWWNRALSGYQFGRGALTDRGFPENSGEKKNPGRKKGRMRSVLITEPGLED